MSNFPAIYHLHKKCINHFSLFT